MCPKYTSKAYFHYIRFNWSINVFQNGEKKKSIMDDFFHICIIKVGSMNLVG